MTDDSEKPECPNCGSSEEMMKYEHEWTVEFVCYGCFWERLWDDSHYLTSVALTGAPMKGTWFREQFSDKE